MPPFTEKVRTHFFNDSILGIRNYGKWYLNPETYDSKLKEGTNVFISKYPETSALLSCLSPKPVSVKQNSPAATKLSASYKFGDKFPLQNSQGSQVTKNSLAELQKLPMPLRIEKIKHD